MSVHGEDRPHIAHPRNVGLGLKAANQTRTPESVLLELFVRGSAVEGWEVWGNEANGNQIA